MPGMPARVLGLVVASLIVALAACSSESEPQTASGDDQPASSYRAGDSASSGEDEAAQPAAVQDAGQDAAQTAEDAADSPDSSASSDEADDGLPAGEPAEQPQEQAVADMVITTGHRAGLIADRNVVGDPDAPIVITEYSDFL